MCAIVHSILRRLTKFDPMLRRQSEPETKRQEKNEKQGKSARCVREEAKKREMFKKVTCFTFHFILFRFFFCLALYFFCSLYWFFRCNCIWYMCVVMCSFIASVRPCRLYVYLHVFRKKKIISSANESIPASC